MLKPQPSKGSAVMSVYMELTVLYHLKSLTCRRIFAHPLPFRAIAAALVSSALFGWASHLLCIFWCLVWFSLLPPSHVYRGLSIDLKRNKLLHAAKEKAAGPAPLVQRTHLDVVLQGSVQHGQVSQEGAQVRHGALHHTLKRKQSRAAFTVTETLKASQPTHPRKCWMRLTWNR